MNKLIASESIDYQYNYYKQALYRKYKREGIDGAVRFMQTDQSQRAVPASARTLRPTPVSGSMSVKPTVVLV